MPVRERIEYHVVLLDGLAPTPPEWRRAIIGTAAVHLVLLLALLSIPRDNQEPLDKERPRQVTQLFDPPTRVTQKAPNKAPLTKEISVAPQIEAPQITKPQVKRFTPPPAQPTPRAPQPRNTPHQAPQQPPQQPAPEPPKIKAQAPPPVQVATNTAVAPPAPPSAQPRIVLENVPPPTQPGHGTGLLRVPSSSVQEAVQALSQTGGSAARIVPDTAGGPAARKQPSIEMEIMSDPNGVDMKPYLLRVLQSVRRNWLAVYPESARLGLRGQVVVQFAIAPDGGIAKTVFISQAPSEALNRAVISAFSMSNPLPALPAEYKGGRLILQFTFSYNVPK